MTTTRINQALLQQTANEARISPRLRKNVNFHPADDFPAHRLINAMQLGSYVRPHRHLDPSKDETIVALQGRFGYLSFNEHGGIQEAVELTAGGPVFGIDIPHGTFHGWCCLEANSIFFETKAGPYAALEPAEKAAFAPAEGDPCAPDYLAWLKNLCSTH